FRLVDHHDPRRLEARDLTAELRPDRSPSTRHEDGVTLEIPGSLSEVDLYGLASEHVLDLHRADLRREIEVAGDQLVQPGQRLHRNAGNTGFLDDPGALLTRRR